jgi:membrane protease YdiL (CAAX protease family)
MGRLGEGAGRPAGIAIPTAVFVLAHLPGWIGISHLSADEMAARAVAVGVVGVIAALLRMGSGSLVPALLFHGAWDMIAV